MAVFAVVPGLKIVVPAEAGTHILANPAAAQWIPAFAGMTMGKGKSAGLPV